MARLLRAAGMMLLQLALPTGALMYQSLSTVEALSHSPEESAAMRKEAFEKNEFTVELNLAKAREAGTPLGLKVDIESEFAPPSLKVISDGIVREWNEANPDREVLVGDHIAGVDGQAWHHNARSLGERMKSMFQAVKKSAPGAAEFLNMNIRRPRATELPQLQDLHSRLCARSFRAQLEIPVSRVERTLADALGLQLNVSGGYWMPAIIGEVKRGGLVAKWNEDNPENSLLPGDEIMGVNGVTWQHNSYAFIQKVVKEFKAPRSNKLEQKGALTLALSARRPALRPGRTQPLREGDQHAQVEKARWERRCGGLELDPVLGSGAVVLMDAEWMVRRARTGGVLEPRQALPPTAFMPHSAVKAATPLVPLLRIACISHGWLQAGIGEPGELLLPPRHCRLHADAVSR